MKVKQRFRRLNWLALTAFLALFGGVATKTAVQDSTVRLQPLRISVGSKAPDFALPSGGGKTVRLSDFAGHNVLVDFYRGYW